MIKKLLNGVFFFALSFVCASVFLPAAVEADAAPFEYNSGNPTIAENKDISLSSEVLNITLNKECSTARVIEGSMECNYFDVEAIFSLDNPNKDTDLDIFFPFPGDMAGGFYEQGDEFKGSGYDTILDTYSVTMNGEKPDWKTKVINTDDPDFVNYRSSLWLISKIDVKKGVNKLVIKYSSPITYTYMGGYNKIPYILTSGSLWSGPIGHLKIVLTFPVNYSDKRFYSKHYEFEKVTDTVWQYEKYGVEPVNDLDVYYISKDIWNMISPYVRGGVGNLSLKQREDLLISIMDKAGNKGLFLYDEDSVISDVFKNHLYAAVEEGSENERVRGALFYFHMDITNRNLDKIEESVSAYADDAQLEYYENWFNLVRDDGVEYISKYFSDDSIVKESLEELEERKFNPVLKEWEEDVAEDESDDSHDVDKDEKKDGKDKTIVTVLVIILLAAFGLLVTVVFVVLIVLGRRRTKGKGKKAEKKKEKNKKSK